MNILTDTGLGHLVEKIKTLIGRFKEEQSVKDQEQDAAIAKAQEAADTALDYFSIIDGEVNLTKFPVVTTENNGLIPALPDDADQFFNGIGEWINPSIPIEIIEDDNLNLNKFFDKQYMDKSFYINETSSLIENGPIVQKDKKDVTITPFYMKTYSIVPELYFGQLIIDKNNTIWVRTSSMGEISDWSMVYSTSNYTPSPSLGTTGSSELDDFTIQCGSFYNQGKGWNIFIFPKPFDGVPQVFANTENYDIEIRNITKDCFEYHLYEYRCKMPVIQIPESNFSLQIPEQPITLHPTMYNSYITSITADPIPAVDINLKKEEQKIESYIAPLIKSDVSNSVEINYVAIEYGGE